ncbi:thiamine pyrophosphate-dependent enzyme [Actinomadura sp. DC4]|uniref:thiamine pyrophosphate-dependent enzyme n=1 Tax=Actinomadura sp. DC4 TaxID=3055069 RepID=UPI0025B25FB7|nr:thiamine pyrophosphate-dependent enzyme [Actinomadura sp. DC4]MDN3359086.1 thiamine pyrophosphate-binding protein [Actinomadura sp. DC4]
MTTSLDGGEAVLAACRTLGVEVIFSSPGSEWAPVWEAMARQERDEAAGPLYLDLLHETLAVAMATGYALVTGRPQMVLLHAGPGLLQGSCGIHGALLSGAPMVVCSAESITYGEGAVDPGSQWYRNLSIVGGPQAIAAPFVKWSNQAADASTVYGMVVRAGEIAQRAPAGPVYLNVPVEALLEPWTPPVRTASVAPPGGTVAARPDLERVAALLAASRRPLIVTESAGRAPEAFAALVGLAESLAVPVVEPQSAVCANFPSTHPLHQGERAEGLAAEADLILLVGCRAPWYPPSAKPGDATVVVVDEVPHRPHIAYQVLTADAYLEGGVARTLRALAEEVAAIGVDAELVGARHAEFAEAHKREAARLSDEESLVARADGIDPVLVVSTLRELLDPDATVVDETITHSRTVRRHLNSDRPGRYTYVQGGLGQGLGVALGVKLAAREREVAFVVGDGSFLYNPIVQSLAASEQLGLPLLIVVFNNGQYRSMKLNHLRFYPDGAAVRTGRFHGVDLGGQPDLAALVEPFGMFGRTVTAPGELRTALTEALAAVRDGRTALVNVQVDR